MHNHMFGMQRRASMGPLYRHTGNAAVTRQPSWRGVFRVGGKVIWIASE